MDFPHSYSMMCFVPDYKMPDGGWERNKDFWQIAQILKPALKMP